LFFWRYEDSDDREGGGPVSKPSDIALVRREYGLLRQHDDKKARDILFDVQDLAIKLAGTAEGWQASRLWKQEFPPPESAHAQWRELWEFVAQAYIKRPPKRDIATKAYELLGELIACYEARQSNTIGSGRSLLFMGWRSPRS